MSSQYYNRYDNFLINGNQTVVPFLTLPQRVSDQKYIYRSGQSRLDKISYEKYGTPYFGWLIQMANPIYGGLESNIPDGTILIIPFPLIAALQDYKSALDTHIFYYGR
jgi:hypothetical protein